jgi:glycosyltransferase involved in cell wall biosynthesis
MKGIEYLIDALALLKQQGCPVYCRVAGSGESRASLRERCLKRGVTEQVEWLGHVEDMQSFYRSIDCFVLPSVSDEGLPLGILEAMASGLPIVATEIAGVSEAVRDGIDGLLVPPRDPSALASALMCLLNDAEDRLRMGRAGRGRVEGQFSKTRFANDILTQYKALGITADYQ